MLSLFLRGSSIVFSRSSRPGDVACIGDSCLQWESLGPQACFWFLSFHSIVQEVWFPALVFQIDLSCGEEWRFVIHGALCPIGRFRLYDPVRSSDSCLQWESVDP